MRQATSTALSWSMGHLGSPGFGEVAKRSRFREIGGARAGESLSPDLHPDSGGGARYNNTKSAAAVDPAAKQQYVEAFAANSALISKTVATFNSRSVPAAQKAAVKTFEGDWQTFVTLRAHSNALTAAGKVAEAPVRPSATCTAPKRS
jgi:hypothetical protein